MTAVAKKEETYVVRFHSNFTQKEFTNEQEAIAYGIRASNGEFGADFMDNHVYWVNDDAVLVPIWAPLDQFDAYDDGNDW